MSAISVSSPVELEVAVRPRPVVVGIPGNVLVPPVAVPRRRRARARTANMFATVLLNGMVLTVFGMATFVASGFVGNVELEAANREALRSTDRANAATLAEGGLHKAVNNLQQDDYVDRWAKYNRFDPPYKLAPAVKPALKK